ncbi:hypothetical protein B0I35DRAFT_440190 [Stachybotrys elegans]|uniref:Uncharacterized protein n=1 Tax=Stachybotrys elegans TaxID=80388 RepID=A0A8K0SJ40_9HYPO|nr:hypothetical protein B0I35DRAFT_440190 [Stachybotrys elegans]
MCGPENTNRPRGGAIVALGPPGIPGPLQLGGDLAFHTPGSPGSLTASHARLTPTREFSLEELQGLQVVIHYSGDMTRSAGECGLFRRLDLDGEYSGGYIELPLEKPLSLEVGNNGIIGRRVSLISSQSVLAEGIVGFNYTSTA